MVNVIKKCCFTNGCILIVLASYLSIKTYRTKKKKRCPQLDQMCFGEIFIYSFFREREKGSGHKGFIISKNNMYMIIAYSSRI